MYSNQTLKHVMLHKHKTVLQMIEASNRSDIY